MTENIKEVLVKYIDEHLILAVASNPGVKADSLPAKVKIRPVAIKGRIMFQAAKTVGTQEIHENRDADGTVALLGEMIDSGPCFGQLELKNADSSVTILISRKGHVSIRERRQKQGKDIAENKNGRDSVQENKAQKHTPETKSAGQGGISIPGSVIGGPDREKNYILREGVPVPFLVELGVMNKDGYIVKARYDKFRQINRYLEFVKDVVPELIRRNENHILKIIDFGCGKSYLTFALYHFLHESMGLNVRITGLDLKKDVIADCSRLAQRLGYNDLEFKHGDIADYETTGGVDMVVTLHACDTATDYALYNAIRWNAGVIFCVPCCQHELNKQIRNKELEPVLKYGIIKERVSALITDAMRAEMLEEQGYKTQILEFIDMEHTPKNLLIRAVKKAGFRSMPVGKNTAKTICDEEQMSTNEETSIKEKMSGSEQTGVKELQIREEQTSASGNVAAGQERYEKLLSDLSAELTLHRLLRQD